MPNHNCLAMRKFSKNSGRPIKWEWYQNKWYLNIDNEKSIPQKWCGFCGKSLKKRESIFVD